MFCKGLIRPRPRSRRRYSTGPAHASAAEGSLRGLRPAYSGRRARLAGNFRELPGSHCERLCGPAEDARRARWELRPQPFVFNHWRWDR